MDAQRRITSQSHTGKNTCFQIWGQVFGIIDGARFSTAKRALPAVFKLLAAIAVGLALASQPAFAQTPVVTLQIGSPEPVTSLDFEVISGPDVTASIASVPASFTVIVTTTDTSTWTLEVNASQPYLDPLTDLIPVGDVSWTATGSTFSSGTLSISPETVAAGSGSGTFTGTLSFFLMNKWTYDTGSYTDTITYTATAI